MKRVVFFLLLMVYLRSFVRQYYALHQQIVLFIYVLILGFLYADPPLKISLSFSFTFLLLYTAILWLLSFIMFSPQLNRFSKLRRKRVKFLNHLNFLTRCKYSKIIPNFIKLKCSVPNSFRISKALLRSQLLILRACIQDTRQSLSKIEEELYDLHLFLSKNMPTFFDIDHRTWNYSEKLKTDHLNKLANKFSILCKNQKPSHKVNIPNSNDNFIVNLSSHTLTSDQKSVLNLGLNFSKSGKPSLPKLIAPIESSFKNSKVSPAQKDTLRYILADAIASNNSFDNHNLSYSQSRALNELKSNSNIIITKADKGGQVIVMDKHDYVDKVNTLLSDGPYIEVSKDPSNSHLSKVKNVVKKSVILNDHTKFCVTPSAAICARFYALPKVHKPNVPLRPIVSNIGTATYPLAKFLASTFSPLCVNNVHTIKNSYDFVNKLNNINPSNCSMLSLDVKSLFTNVPVTGALTCLESRLREFHYSDIEVKELINLTNLCINQTTFEFNNKFYKQSDGLAMGNPLSPILCDIYMHYFEEKLLPLLNFKLWLRYVDDTFILVENPFDVSNIMQIVNSIDPHIQFTFELENSNQLPFLDVLVTKCNSFFKTSVYRKPFSVSTPPHALSNHPASQKAAAFYSYVYRALKICSDDVSLYEELNYIKNVAVNRGFKPSLIDKAIKKFKNPNRVSNLSKLDDFNFDNLIVLPFYPPLSFKLAKILKRFNFKVIFKPVNKIKFSSTKSPIPESKKWGIYNVPCNGCNLSYIGQTRRNLETRLKEHARYVSKQEISKSSIAKHSWDSGHSFNFNNAKIIFNATSCTELDFLENLAIYINRKSIVNEKSDSIMLSNAWKNLFSNSSNQNM